MKPNANSLYPQSGVIPFRFEASGIKVMLITSMRRKRWIIPKGLIEEDMTAAESAQMEAFEEAGIKGRIYPDIIGEYQRQKWDGVCEIRVFLLEVKEVFDEWPESSFRKRMWMSSDEAEQLVEEGALKNIFRKLASYIDRARLG